MPVPLWNVTYMLNRQISGEILKESFGESQVGGLKNGGLAEKVYIDLTVRGKVKTWRLCSTLIPDR